jgi:threonine dehydrogenase-like Zn-dependent dehydrogenase
MKALVYNNGIQLCSTAKPRREQNESLIRVMASGLCRTDNWIAQGKIPVTNGRIIGHEFSGIIEDSNKFTKGTTVAVFPFISCGQCQSCINNNYSMCPYKKQLGWHCDGSFAQYISVPDTNIYAREMKTENDFIMYAYAEPVSASLGVLNGDIKETDKVFIWGDNRIAELTYRCLKLLKYDVSIGMQADDDCYDVVIETCNNYNDMIKCLKPGGKLIIKSRRLQDDCFSSLLAVNKSIEMKATNHYDFEYTLDLLPKLDYNDLWGKIYKMNDALKFIDSDGKESRKSFLLPWE